MTLGRHRAHPLAGAARYGSSACPSCSKPAPPEPSSPVEPPASVRHHDHAAPPLPPPAPARSRRPPRRAPRFGLLRSLRTARSTLQLPDGTQARFGSAATASRARRCALRNWNVCARRAAQRRHRLCRELHRRRLELRPTWRRCSRCFIANRDAIERRSTAAGGARCCTASSTCSTATRAAAAARTSTPTTTSATRSTACGSTRR